MKKCGFVYIASLSKAYYKAAVNSAISLRDNYPEADITLFTHKAFLQQEDKKFFNNIFTDIPVHKRAKMWGMQRTPYDITLYLDSDTEIRSQNIKNVFDILGKNDIMFTKIVPHVSNGTYIDDNNDLEYHGGVILYNNKKLTIQLIEEWYELYHKQITVKWEESEFSQYTKKMQGWDQFTIWHLLRQPKYKKIKHDFFPDGGHSYNFIHLFEDERNQRNKPYLKFEQIVYHYTIPGDNVNVGYIKTPPGSITDFN